MRPGRVPADDSGMTFTLIDQPVAQSTGRDFEGADQRVLLRGGLFAAVPYLAGIAFAIWFLNTTHPAFDATPLEAAVGFRDNAANIAIGTVLFLLPYPFVLMFLGGLTSLVRRSGAALSTTALAAGLVDVALFVSATMVSSITSTVGALDASAATGAVIKALDGVLPVTIAAAGLARAVLLGAFAVLLRRSGLAGRVLRGFTWTVAALGVVGVGTVFTAALFPITELAMILSWVWMAILGARLPGRINR